MLRKLLKHEFRATARIMGPLYLVLIVLSIGANLSIRILDSGTRNPVEVLGVIVLIAFGIAIAGAGIVSVVLMVNRFRTNLMGEEGYLMFTIPASVDQIVVSKIMVSTVWFVATAAAICVSGLIVVFRASYVEKIFQIIARIFDKLTSAYALNGAAFITELLVLIVAGCASFCLLFYAAIAIGHSFSNHKKLLSVVFFFAIQFVMQTLSSLAARGLGLFGIRWFEGNFSVMSAVHGAMWISITGAVIYGAVYYIITRIMLKKRLNLE